VAVVYISSERRGFLAVFRGTVTALKRRKSNVLRHSGWLRTVPSSRSRLFLIVSCFLYQYSGSVSWCSNELAVKLSKDHSDPSGEEKSVLAFRDVDVPPGTKLLRGLTPPEVDLVLGSATPRRYHAKSVIYRQGDPNQSVMFLREGRARFFYETDNGKKLILRWILRGDVLGLGGLVSQITHYLVGVEAVQDCIVFVWAGPDIRALARRMPQLLENALYISNNYLSWYIATHAALCSQTARERLAHILFVQSISHGRKVAGGMELEATNEELADAANITPYTTSRLMSRWEKRGLIRKRRGKVTLCSPKSLFCLGSSRQAR